MNNGYIRYLKGLYGLPSVVVSLLILISFFSCSDKKNNFVSSFGDESLIPSMKTLDAEVLMSDSGVPRYRVITKEWNVFDKAKEPYWFFPKGVYGEKFDSVFRTEFYLKSDTATFYTEKELWQFDGNVEVKNDVGQILTTSQLFWDRKSRKFWTFRHFRSEEPDGEYLEGSAMRCEENLSRLVVIDAGPGSVSVKKDSVKADSLSVDSLTAVSVPDTVSREKVK